MLITYPLPRLDGELAKRGKPASLARPKPIDALYFLQRCGVDGVFAISIMLIFARESSLAVTVMGGSALLAICHFREAIAAPLFGWIADLFGARRMFIYATALTIVGYILVAAGATIIGALFMLLILGALAYLGPAVITQSLENAEEAIGPLARMQAWCDFGAASAPLVTGFLLAFLSAEIQHGAMAVALAGAFYSGRLPLQAFRYRVR